MPVHVYGIVPERTPLPGEVRGRREAPLRAVRRNGLAAIVSDVDPDVRIRRDDLLAHAHVLEAVVEDSTVLPMRFGVILDSDDEVSEQVLDAGGQRLLTLLAEFDGVQQLTVKAVHDEEEVLRVLLKENPRVRAFREAIGAGGETYDAKLELGRLVAEGIEEIERSDAAHLFDELAPLARDIKVDERSSRKCVLNAALLVDRADRPKIDEAVARLADGLPPRLGLRYVGPQPPYAFVDTALAGEHVWA